jgi:hypothetical protein
MKKIFFVFMVIAFSSQLFAQPTTPSQPLTKADYLQKSKSQKTTGFVFLGIAATCIAIAAPGDVSFGVLPVLVIGGAGAAVGSILLFSAARRNKRKAMSMAASIEAKKIPNVSSSGILYSSYPAISLKIKL